MSVTDWTQETELFMEYPPLVAGTQGRFAVHLTNLADFHALAKGRVTIELQPDAGQAETFETAGPSSPGIFGVNVTPRSRGYIHDGCDGGVSGAERSARSGAGAGVCRRAERGSGPHARRV